jgi:hypothetical protein
VLEADVDLEREPINEAERLFVRFLILHLASSFEAGKRGLYPSEARLSEDVRDFFDRPIPRAVWEELRPLQESEFAEFVGSLIGD